MRFYSYERIGFASVPLVYFARTTNNSPSYIVYLEKSNWNHDDACYLLNKKIFFAKQNREVRYYFYSVQINSRIWAEDASRTGGDIISNVFVARYSPETRWIFPVTGRYLIIAVIRFYGVRDGSGWLAWRRLWDR